MKVFVSYARDSVTETVAFAFKERLERELRILLPRADVFVDRTMHAGEHFPSEIQQQLDDSDALLILLSPAWLQRPRCREEFNYFTRQARDEHKVRRLVPLRWAETPEVKEESDDVVARTLSQINYSDWTSLRHRGFRTAPMGAHFARLAQALLRTISEPAPPNVDVRPTDRRQSSAANAVPEASPQSPEALVYGPSSDYKKDIRSLMIEALSPEEIHIERFVFNESATISDLEAMCTRVLYPKRDAAEVRRRVGDARRTAYTRKYAIQRLDDEKIALDSQYGPWTKYLESLLSSKGVTGTENARVIDVGHGTGQAYTIDSFFPSLKRFTVTDVSEQALAQASRLLPKAYTVVADAEDLAGVPTASQDIYLSFRTYNSTLFHRRRAAWEACRVLSAGGVAVVSIPRIYYVHKTRQTFSGLGNSQQRITLQYLYRIVNEVREHFEALGFRDVTVSDRSPYEIFVFARRT